MGRALADRHRPLAAAATEQASRVTTMTTRDIRPTDTYVVCDVCGRTLLRGERSEAFLHGGVRRSVCELCKSRALHEGWVREGGLPDFARDNGSDERRRSLFARRRRREGSQPTLDDALSAEAWEEPPGQPSRTPRRVSRRAAAAPNAEPAAPPRVREPRHVHAVPSSADHRITAALEQFNASAHPRTIAGVARSLGAPTVSVIPDPQRPALVRVVAAWELCWYRYEVDLGDQHSGVRLDTQGYELSELSAAEQTVTVTADDAGRLLLA